MNCVFRGGMGNGSFENIIALIPYTKCVRASHKIWVIFTTYISKSQCPKWIKTSLNQQVKHKTPQLKKREDKNRNLWKEVNIPKKNMKKLSGKWKLKCFFFL